MRRFESLTDTEVWHLRLAAMSYDLTGEWVVSLELQAEVLRRPALAQELRVLGDPAEGVVD